MRRRIALLGDSPRPAAVRPDRRGATASTGTSGAATSRTSAPTRWSSSGARRSPSPSTKRAPGTRGVCVRRRHLMVEARRVLSIADDVFGAGAGGARRGPPPRRRRAARRARTGPHRRDARHRRDHPAGTGRSDPGAAARRAHGAGRARHRQDRDRAPPRRLPPLQPPGARACRGDGGRPEPRVPGLHRAGAAVARRGSGVAGHARRPRARGEGARCEDDEGRSSRRGRAGEGRRPHGGGDRARGRAAAPSSRAMDSSCASGCNAPRSNPTRSTGSLPSRSRAACRTSSAAPRCAPGW